MDVRIADPKALGFGALAVSVWPYSTVHAGWLAPTAFASAAAHDVAVFATFALLIAALAAFLRGETWYAVFFMFFSAFWWGIQTAGGAGEAAAFQGWYYLAAAVFAGLLWLGSLQAEGVGGDVTLVALGGALSVLGISLTDLGLAGFFDVAGGYVGLATALVSFWVAARALTEPAGAAEEAPAGGGAGEAY